MVKGTAKYRLVDEQVRYFVAPAIEDIINSPVCLVSHSYPETLLTLYKLRPYVYKAVRLTEEQKQEVYGPLPQGGLTPQTYYDIAPRSSPEDVSS